MGFRAWGLGFRVWGPGLNAVEVQGLNTLLEFKALQALSILGAFGG